MPSYAVKSRQRSWSFRRFASYAFQAGASGLLLIGFSGCLPVDGDFGDFGNLRGSPKSRCARGTPRRGGGQSAGREDVLALACYLLWTGNPGLSTIEERLRTVAPYCVALDQWSDGCDARSASPYK